jgi:hypothetical protein
MSATIELKFELDNASTFVMLNCPSCPTQPALRLDKELHWCCPECDNHYLACSGCPDGIDDVDYDKGLFCAQCGDHYCQWCWQQSGVVAGCEESSDELVPEDEEYICAKCAQ